jgi:hypothetical protein
MVCSTGRGCHAGVFNYAIHPNVERRGWTKDSLRAGEVIVIDGWPARDGSHYLRMRSAKRADGSPVGVPFEAAEQQR